MSVLKAFPSKHVDHALWSTRCIVIVLITSCPGLDLFYSLDIRLAMGITHRRCILQAWFVQRKCKVLLWLVWSSTWSFSAGILGSDELYQLYLRTEVSTYFTSQLPTFPGIGTRTPFSHGPSGNGTSSQQWSLMPPPIGETSVGLGHALPILQLWLCYDVNFNYIRGSGWGIMISE